MRLTVFGATGGTGRRVVEQALDAGHRVTAVVRDPARLSVGPRDTLDVVVADATEDAAIRGAVAGREAIISAVGNRRGATPATACTDVTHAVIAAMRAADVRRLLVVSAAGMYTDGDGPVSRLVVKPILRRMLAEHFADMYRMSDEVQESGLDWTIVRPPMLTEGRRTGRYRVAYGRNVRGGMRLSRADLADCLIRLAGDPQAMRTTVAPAY